MVQSLAIPDESKSPSAWTQCNLASPSLTPIGTLLATQGAEGDKKPMSQATINEPSGWIAFLASSWLSSVALQQ